MANNALYSTGVVSVLESKLLRKEKFNAMIEAETLEGCLKILHDAGFADGKGSETGNFEPLLKAEIAKNVALLKELSSDENAADALLIRYDYHNLKALLKAQSTNTLFDKIKETLYSGGTIDLSVMQVELMEGGENLRPLMKEVIAKVSGSQNAKDIDLTADLAMYRDILGLIKKTASKVVTKYFKDTIDFVNISTLIRNKTAQAKDYSGQFIEGGNLPLSLFVSAQDKPMEEFFKSLKSVEYISAAEIAETSLKECRNLLGYELFYKNLLLEKVWEGRNKMDGIEPVLYYFFAKETEIDNVRLILTCKKNKVDKKMIYQRLREVYV